MCRVVGALPDEDGMLRKVKLEVGSQKLAPNGKRSQPLSTLERPIHKPILLMSTLMSEYGPGDPVEEPSQKTYITIPYERTIDL